MGCPGVQQPGLGLVGGRNFKVRRALDIVDLQCLRVAGRKGVAADLGKEVGRGAHDVEQVLAFYAHLGHAGQQSPGVGVAGVIVDLVGGADLYDVAGGHHGHPVGNVGHDAQVVGDHDDGQVVLGPQLLEQLQNLSLNGHIQRRSGFVGEEDVRVQGQRDGKHAPLAHPPGKIVRLQNALEPVNDNELVIKYKIVRHRIFLGAESFFFEEGQDTLYQKAVYGGLKVDGKGQSLLVGLYDENFHYIQSDK